MWAFRHFLQALHLVLSCHLQIAQPFLADFLMLFELSFNVRDALLQLLHSFFRQVSWDVTWLMCSGLLILGWWDMLRWRIHNLRVLSYKLRRFYLIHRISLLTLRQDLHRKTRLQNATRISRYFLNITPLLWYPGERRTCTQSDRALSWYWPFTQFPQLNWLFAYFWLLSNTFLDFFVSLDL